MINGNIYYTSYIQRERHAIVDAAVQASVETLQVAQIASRLGETAVHLMDILQNVTVPDIRNHKVRFDQHQFDDRTPIAAVHPDEVVFVNPCDVKLNAKQRKSITTGFGQDNADQMFELQDYFASGIVNPVRIDSLHNIDVLAYTSSCPIPLTTVDGDMEMSTSPLVLINAVQPAHRDPTVLLHELTHVYQLHEYPVVMPGEDPDELYMEREFEAYHVEAEIVRGYQDAGQCDELIRRIGERQVKDVVFADDIRHLHRLSDDEPFAVTDRMIRALQQNGINMGQ